MFERTVSLWRRLVGSPYGTQSGVAEDRRRSRRYSTHQEVIYRLATDKGQQTPLSAQLRNVSVGGINLVTDREVRPGELLSIQLPGTSEENPTRVLACVIHVLAQEENQWAVGCTFARELAAEDLEAFGADPRANGADQRARPRILCEIEASYQLVGEEKEENWTARVHNISTTGVGLVVHQPVVVGTLLNVELHSTGETNSKNLLCCAVHVTQQDQAEWVVGCNYITEMAEADLNSLIHK